MEGTSPSTQGLVTQNPAPPTTLTVKAPLAQTSKVAQPTTLVEFKDVKKYYDQGRTKALDGVSLTMHVGEFVSVVGTSGAGKSTLVKLLIREERATGGQVLVAGRDISKLSFHDVPFYRRKLGVVFQDFKLLSHKTVFENVAYALEICDVDDPTIQVKVPKVLEMVGLTKLAKRYPSEISGGEQQRTAIARALVHDPQIIVADEPTGNLDPDSSVEIIETFKAINKKGTLVIFASHNKAIVDGLGQRVILLREGKVASDQSKGKYVL